jgi:cytochrome b561
VPPYGYDKTSEMDQSMPPTTTPDRYSSASITLHWLMFLGIAATYTAIELHEVLQRGSSAREASETAHYVMGLSVFALVWLRIAARFAWPAPPAIDKGWRQAASVVTHGLLYVLMITMPLAGWILLSAEGETVRFLGAELPSLMREDRALAEQVEELHELGGTIGYWLIGLHAAAALFHHYFLRDGLMGRMRPGRA